MLTTEQIAAGAAVLCDHGKPIGRNAAICVFDAMQSSTVSPTEPRDDLRNAFERWALDEFAFACTDAGSRGSLLDREGDEYFSLSVNARWKGWKAAAAYLAAPSSTEASAQAATDDVRNAALEEAAKLCEAIESDKFDAYKGRGKHSPNNSSRADTYVNGESDGAGQCAMAIRRLKTAAATPAQAVTEDKP